MVVPPMRWLAAPPTRKECSMHRLSSIPAAHKWVWRFGVICTGVSARFPLAPLSRTLGKRNPEISTSADRLDTASCRYSIMATTALISRQSAFLLTITAWEDSRNVKPKRKLNVNPSPLDICNNRDASAAHSSNQRLLVWKATRTFTAFRTIAKRSAAVGRVDTRRRMSTTSLRN